MAAKAKRQHGSISGRPVAYAAFPFAAWRNSVAYRRNRSIFGSVISWRVKIMKIIIRRHLAGNKYDNQYQQHQIILYDDEKYVAVFSIGVIAALSWRRRCSSVGMARKHNNIYGVSEMKSMKNKAIETSA